MKFLASFVHLVLTMMREERFVHLFNCDVHVFVYLDKNKNKNLIDFMLALLSHNTMFIKSKFCYLNWRVNIQLK